MIHIRPSTLAVAVALCTSMACGSEQTRVVVATTPSADAGATVTVVGNTPTTAAVAQPGDAAPQPADVGVVMAVTDAADLAPQVATSDCWKGFTPTGNAVSDVNELGRRCAVGMAQLVAPVKYGFRSGETRSVPVALVPGCYRVIAVGGNGVKDVNLMLRDNVGKIVAADLTPDDVFPMINPKSDFCVDALQMLNFVIEVKKGSGEVAGAVWKR